MSENDGVHTRKRRLLRCVLVVGGVLAAACAAGCNDSDAPKPKPEDSGGKANKTAPKGRPPEEYLKKICLDTPDTFGDWHRITSASGLIMIMPGMSKVTGKEIYDKSRIKTTSKADIASAYYICHVKKVRADAETAQYKISYIKAIVSKTKAGVGDIGLPGCMWLTLKKQGDAWTWDHAEYLTKSEFDTKQTDPPEKGLISEQEAEKKSALTRKALRQAGLTP